MQNPKLKLFILTLTLALILSAGIYLILLSSRETKIFGCTEYDIYDGPNHEKLEPKDLYCNLNLLELDITSKAEHGGVGLVEYNLNPTGILTIFAIFIIIPFSISYSLAFHVLKKLSKNKTLS